MKDMTVSMVKHNDPLHRDLKSLQCERLCKGRSGSGSSKAG